MTSISELNLARTVEVSLTVDPTTANFPASGCKSEHFLVNTGTRRVAVKMCCSNNTAYRMSPVTCFIESGAVQTLVINRLNGPSRMDKVVVQYCESGQEDQDAKDRIGQTAKEKIDSVKIMMYVDGSKEDK